VSYAELATVDVKYIIIHAKYNITKADGFENQPFSPAQGTPKSLGFQNCASQRYHLRVLQVTLRTIEKKLSIFSCALVILNF
jgi:hypothetical protein